MNSPPATERPAPAWPDSVRAAWMEALKGAPSGRGRGGSRPFESGARFVFHPVDWLDAETGAVDPSGPYRAACRGLQALGCVVGPYSPGHPTAALRGCARPEPWPRMLLVMRALLTAIVCRADGASSPMRDCDVVVKFRQRPTLEEFEAFYRGAFGSRPASVEPPADTSSPARDEVAGTIAPSPSGAAEARRGLASRWSRPPAPVSAARNLSAEPGQSEPLETRDGPGAVAPGAVRDFGREA